MGLQKFRWGYRSGGHSVTARPSWIWKWFVALAEDLGLEGLGQRHSEEKKPCLEKTLQVQDEKKAVAKVEPNLSVEPPGMTNFKRDNLL